MTFDHGQGIIMDQNKCAEQKQGTTVINNLLVGMDQIFYIVADEDFSEDDSPEQINTTYSVP